MAINLREDIELDELYDFIENGTANESNTDIMQYLVELDKVRGMYLRIDRFASKDAIVNHLQKVDGYSRYLANKLFNQAMEYFYCDTTISKAAWRNIYAEKMEKVINFAIATMQDTSDAAKVSKMILEMAKVRQLDQPDKEELPMELFTRPFKIYSSDAEFLGLPEVNRLELSEFIDKLPDLSDAQKELIKRESQILPVKVFLDEHENPRKA